MTWVGLEPTIAADERPKTYALDRAATGTGYKVHNDIIFYVASIAFHTIVPAIRKCKDTSGKKSILAETAATRAPPAAPLRRT